MECRVSQTMVASVRAVADVVFTAMHMTYGQPGRGEELAQIYLTNANQVDRSLFWVEVYSTIMVVSRYHKSREVMNRDRYVARYMPRQLAHQLVQYLVLVRPLEG